MSFEGFVLLLFVGIEALIAIIAIGYNIYRFFKPKISQI